MLNLRDSNGRSLYFGNRKEYYRRKHISQSLKRYYTEKKISSQFQTSEKEIKKFTRYSVVYMDVKKENGYKTSFRAEIVNPDSAKGIIEKLKAEMEEYLKKKRSEGRLSGWFMKMGFEKEEIDEIEASNYEINKIEISRG